MRKKKRPSAKIIPFRDALTETQRRNARLVLAGAIFALLRRRHQGVVVLGSMVHVVFDTEAEAIELQKLISEVPAMRRGKTEADVICGLLGKIRSLKRDGIKL